MTSANNPRPGTGRGAGERGSTALLLVAVLLSTSVHAADARPMSVVLTLSGPEAETQALDASIRELVTRLGLEVVPSAEDPLARVTVELGEAECTASITNRAGALASFRRVARGPSTQVTLEAVAHVVQSAVEELAELERNPPTRRVRVPEPSTPPIVTAPVATPPPATPGEGLGLELGALASGRAFSEDAFVFGGGVLVSLRWDRDSRWSPRGSLLATYNGPFTVSNDVVQVSTQSFSVRLLGGVRFRASPRWAFDAEAGAGVDGFVPASSSTTLPPPAVGHPHVEVSPIVTAALTARFGLTASTDLFLGVSLDVDLLPRRYVSDIQGTREELYEAWRARPAVVLGFSFDVLGGAAP